LIALKSSRELSTVHPGKEVCMPVLGELPCRLPGIAVTHGQALWVLSELGFQEGAAEGTFREYIKSLRKAGIPFATGEIGLKRRGLAIYSYDHLMELALALSLRVYHVVPDALLARIVRHREMLRRQYRYAYARRGSGRGAPAEFRVKGHRGPCCPSNRAQVNSDREENRDWR
jgi:hypothetical protein